MSEAIIGAVAGVAGAFVGGLFSWLAARTGARWTEAQKELVRLARQVAAYHRLESLYAERLGTATGANPATIRVQLRDEVERLGLERPEVTQKEAERLERRWD
jgi:hypothetical protein